MIPPPGKPHYTLHIRTDPADGTLWCLSRCYRIGIYRTAWTKTAAKAIRGAELCQLSGDLRLPAPVEEERWWRDRTVGLNPPADCEQYGARRF